MYVKQMSQTLKKIHMYECYPSKRRVVYVASSYTHRSERDSAKMMVTAGGGGSVDPCSEGVDEESFS